MRGRWLAAFPILLGAALTVGAAPLLVQEFVTDLGRGPVVVRYLYIPDWQRDYLLLPALSEGGVGTLAPLEEIAQRFGADAAINANFFDPATGVPIGLLIRNGTVLRTNYGRRAALGIDLLGRLTFFRPRISLYVRSRGTKVVVDDVNRPLRGDEVLLYTETYAGPVSSSTASLLRVVRLRENRVVELADAAEIAPGEREATLLVASGAARIRLAGLQVGDEADPGFDLDEGPLLITDAVSAGPLLLASGRDVLDLAAESFDPSSSLVRSPAARSVLATDGFGGLLLLAVLKDEESAGATLQDLVTLLRRFPSPIRDALAFDGGHSSSLVLRDGAAFRELASGGDVAVGLLLVPRGR